MYGLTDSQIDYLVRKPFVEVGLSVNMSRPGHGAREFLDNSLQIFRGG